MIGQETLNVARDTDPGRARTDAQWYLDWDRISASAYMRTVMHALAHVRQVWMPRGAMGSTDEQGWPLQHWA